MESFILQEYINPDICDSIVREFEDNSTKSRFDGVRGYWRLNDRQINQDVIYEYNGRLKNIERNYRDKFKYINQGAEWGLMSPFNIQKYEPGYAYNPIHIEGGGPEENKFQRILAFTTYLNDIEVDGETEFIYQQMKVQPKKGLTIIWPAGWTHPHRGIPAPNETKYIATGWFSYYLRCKKA